MTTRTALAAMIRSASTGRAGGGDKKDKPAEKAPAAAQARTQAPSSA